MANAELKKSKKEKKDKKDKKLSKKKRAAEGDTPVSTTTTAADDETKPKAKKAKVDKEKKSKKGDKNSDKKDKKNKKKKSKSDEVEDDGDADENEEPKKKKVKKDKKSKKSKKEKKSDETDKASADDAGQEETTNNNSKVMEEEKKEAEAIPAAVKTDASVSGVNPDAICKCFIGNLSFKIDDDTCKDFFKDCGEIEDLYWCLDKETEKFYGTGFITFTTPEGALKAIAKSGMDLLGRPIKVEFAKPRAGGKTPRKGRKTELSAKPDGCQTVFIGNLSYDIDDDKTKEFFGKCGEINKIRWLTDRESGDFKGCGFVEFYEESAVDEAVKLNGGDLMGRAIRIDYAAPSKPKNY